MSFPRPPRLLRCIGFDDAPFGRRRGSAVPLIGAVCAGTRFEGMVFGNIRRDGLNTTREVVRLLEEGKFLPQLHLILFDGLAFGGLNLLDLPAISARLGRPCVALMRRPPDLERMELAVRKLPQFRRRLGLIEKAGPVHRYGPFYFQVQGAPADEVGEALDRLTDTGNVPEALRLAHMIGGAIVTGQSGRRA